MAQNNRDPLATDQPSARDVAGPITAITPRSLPSRTVKRLQPPNSNFRQPCAVCRKAICLTRNVCGIDVVLSHRDPIPPRVPRKSSSNRNRGGQPRRLPTNRASSLTNPTADPSVTPTVPQKPQKPESTQKPSNTSSGPQISQPKQPPSQDKPQGRPKGSYLPPHLRNRSRQATPQPQQRQDTSRPSAREQGPALRPSTPRRRPHCRDWLKGNCPRGSHCAFTHDPEAQAAEGLRLKKITEEQATEPPQKAAAITKEAVHPSTKPIFDVGMTVKVPTSLETCSVLVKNLPPTATRAKMITFFTQAGFHPAKFTVSPPLASPDDHSHLETVVEFEDPEDGKKAVSELNGVEFGSEKIKLAIASRRGSTGEPHDQNSHILAVTWQAPSKTFLASYPSPGEAYSRQTELEGKIFGGRKIKTNPAQKHPKLPNNRWKETTISVSGFGPGTQGKSIQEFCGTAFIKVTQAGTYNYNLSDAVRSLYNTVVKECPGNYGAVTWEPDLIANEHGLVMVKIHFPHWNHAKAVHDFLDQKPLPLCPQAKYQVSLPDPPQYVVYVPYPRYKAQEELFRSLVPPQDDQTASVCVRIYAPGPDRPARVKISGWDREAMEKLKARIEQLVEGEKLPQWDQEFSRAQGETFLKKVNDKSGAYIRVDKRQNVLTAFGEQAAVEQARGMIQEEMDRLASLR